MKRYTFEMNGEIKFKNVSPENEQKFFDKYGEYNPTLVPEEPGKSQGTSQSQSNQQQQTNTESNSEDGSSESQPNNAFTRYIEKSKKGLEDGDIDSIGEFGYAAYDILANRLPNSATGGWGDQGGLGDKLKLAELGKDIDKETLQRIADNYVTKSKEQPDAAMLRFVDHYSEGSEEFKKRFPNAKPWMADWWGFAKGAIEEPATAPDLLVRSGSGQLRYLTPEVLGGEGGLGEVLKAGTTAAIAQRAMPGNIRKKIFGMGTAFMGGAMFKMNQQIELGNTFTELLAEKLEEHPDGPKEFNLDNINDILQDEDMVDDIRYKSWKRGTAIGGVETLAMGIGGGVFKSIKAVKLSQKIARLTAVGGVEAVGGSLGEYAGQKAAGQETDILEIGFEGFAGMGGAPVSIGTTLLEGGPKYVVKDKQGVETKVSREDMLNFLEKESDVEITKADIEITNDPELQKIYNDKYQNGAIESQLDARINDPIERQRAVDLEKQRIDLESKIEKEQLVSNKNIFNQELVEVENELAQISGNYTAVTDNAATEARSQTKKQVREEVFKSNLQFAKKHSAIYGLEINDQLTREQIRKQYGDELADADGGIVGDKIIINVEVASQTKAVNVGNHELLHGVLRKAMKDNPNQFKDIESQLKEQVGSQWSVVEDRVKDSGYSAEYMEANPDEWITLTSDAIQNNEITYSESVFQPLIDTFLPILRAAGFKNINFDTGKDVYSFLKEYNRSIHKGSLSSGIVKKTGGKTKSTETKFSKSQNPEVDALTSNEAGKKYTQKEWNDFAADKALTKMETENMLDGLIAAKYKVRPIPADFIAKVYSELTSHVRNFKVNENDSLFGWINSYLKFKAGNVFIADTKGAKPMDVKSTDINERTSDGQLKVQVGDTDTQTTKFEEQEIKLNDKEVQEANTEARERKSTFRKEVGIKGIGKSIIFKAVKTAITTADAITNPKEFLNSYEKTLANSLFDYMKKVFPDTNSMVKYRMAILESIPIPTLIQMQKQLTEKIFVKSYGRLTNKTQISDFVYGRNESGKNPGNKKLLTDDILNDTEASKRKRAAGVAVYERLEPSSTQWNNYLEATQKGKRQTSTKSGTKGNNRIKVLEESAKALGKDATPENLTPSFIQEYIDKKGLESEMSVQEVTNTINETIGRPPDLKFSKSPKFAKTPINKTAAKILKEQQIQEGSKFYKDGILIVNMLRAYSMDEYVNKDYSGKKGTLLENVPKETIEYVVKELYLTGKIHYVNSVVLNKLSEGIDKGNARTKGFEQYVINQFASIPGVEPIFEKQSEEGIDIPDFYGVIKIGGVVLPFNVEIKMFDAQVSSLTINSSNINDGTFTINKIKNLSPENQKKVNDQMKKSMVVLKRVQGRMKEIASMSIEELTGLINDLNKNKPSSKIIKVPSEITNKDIDTLNNWNSHKDQFPNYVHGILREEMFWRDFTQEVTFTESLIEDLYLSKEVPTNYIYMLGKGFFHIGTDILNLGSTKLEGKFKGPIRQVKASKKGKNAGYVNIEVRLLPVADKIKRNSSMWVDNLNPQKFMSKDTISNQKFSKSVKVSKAHDTIIKYSKTGKTRGMSTFDFDETVGISENFIIAKKDGKTEKISSDRWPFVGDQMIEDGWVMDFSDFDKVTKGKPGPLFVKMENQIAKYGPENVFILTARGPGSQIAIHEWLKQNGINIPLKNVTGLGQSSGNAKAQWMLDKFAEGYNDMYFVDDALPNVEAVKEVLDQLDIKSKVVQAKIKYSKSLNTDFNDMMERSKGVDSNRRFSAAEARVRGAQGKWTFFVPPSAEDFKGLMRNIIGKGKRGDADIAWFKKALFDPWAKAYVDFNIYKQRMTDEYTDLKKRFPTTVKSLKKKVPGMPYTNDTAIRVYLWSKAGFSIPGLSTQEQYKLIEHVEGNRNLRSFANHLSTVTRVKEGYLKPNEFWTTETIATDLANAVNKVGRTQFLQEWIANKNIIFSQENLNKLEAIYGTDYIDALQDMLYRMEKGTNRVTGKNKMVNGFMNWINGSVGAVMFFNMRSATLQTISMVNFLNFENNNIFAAAKAFANQPQFWADFIFLMNSPMLKQRRAGLQIDVSASELTKAYAEGGNKAQAIIAYLLEKGFTPTKIADSFAIAMGGSTYYRNQVNFYLKQGMTKAKAEAQAFLDFQEIAEETQQSSRPDMISMQQAGPLGRLILAFGNTPMQYTRLIKKAFLDLINGRGDRKTNISKIAYYAFIQNIIFASLQSAMFALMFRDDEEDDDFADNKKERVANTMVDTLLRGTGVYGAGIATIKNMIKQFLRQEEKGFTADHTYTIIEAVNLSPPVGSKLRKLYSAIQTYKFNKDVISHKGFSLDNPAYQAGGNVVSALTNVPLDRLFNKMNNLKASMNSNNEAWQRIALALGWNTWDLDAELDPELAKLKEFLKKKRKADKRLDPKYQQERLKELLKKRKQKLKSLKK